MAQVFPTGSRVRYVGHDDEHSGALATVTGLDPVSEYLHCVTFDKSLGVDPWTGREMTQAKVAPMALELVE